jgi:hypothetical protein
MFVYMHNHYSREFHICVSSPSPYAKAPGTVLCVAAGDLHLPFAFSARATITNATGGAA